MGRSRDPVKNIVTGRRPVQRLRELRDEGQRKARVNPKPGCTLRDVAAHLGVSTATVSRAMRNDPRIREVVRLQVAAAAAALGYRRDPKLAQLMSHVRAGKARAFQGTLAWITDHDLADPAEARAHALYWEHALRRAAELGYKIECFPKAGPGDSEGIDRRLRAQGIEGVVIQQFKAAFHLPDWSIAWPRYAVVHNGCCQTTLRLDSVDADDVGNCVSVFENLLRQGYRRIGVCTLEAIERATNFSLSTAQSRFRMHHPDAGEIPPCLLFDLVSAASAGLVRQWLELHLVDAVVSQVRGMTELLEAAGRRVPEDVGLAWQGVNPNHPNSGMWQREDIMAAVLVETVIASVEQGRKGLPEVPRVIQIPGCWHQGATSVERK